MPNASIVKTSQQLSTAAALPLREQALIADLKDPSIAWQSSRSEDRKCWESGGVLDPFGPQVDLYDGVTPRVHRGLALGGGRFAGGVVERRNLDWHTTETELLQATTDLHEIKFSKTRINSYSHRERHGVDKTFYDVQFVSREDKDQRIALNQTNCPDLAKLFDEISKRIN